MVWDDPEFEELSAELRRQVGEDFRLEAEAAEADAMKLILRRRSIADVANEIMNRGDVVSLSCAGATTRGTITHASNDLAIIETTHSLFNVNLHSSVAIRIVAPAHRGGVGRASGSSSYRARMLELEISGEFVEIFYSASEPVRGSIAVVGKDHLVVADADQTEWIIPLAAITITRQPRPPH